MNKKSSILTVIESISVLHKILGLEKPKHPLVSVIDLKKVNSDSKIYTNPISHNFYSISIKRNVKRKMKYGQQYYDFDEGVMSFMAPKQIMKSEGNIENASNLEGVLLIFHPDFFQKHPLRMKIKKYGFFSYSVNEALHLSVDEEAMILTMFDNIKKEITLNIDVFTQDLIISHIDLLLNYSNRFYNRQFITRKANNNNVLTQVEALLNDYFDTEKPLEKGFPTVLYISESLNVSPNYLSDMLRQLTGMSTKQHIQNALIDKAKEFLTTTELSVSEIAYALGFEYPQSFNKLFKRKTNQTPLRYKQSFN